MDCRHDLSCSVFHVQSVNRPCLDSIGILHLFDLIGSSLTTRLNWFYLYIFLQLDSISLICRLKYIKYNSLFLIPSNHLRSVVLPFAPTWKVVKDTHNYVPMNMIGLAQTSREILEGGDFLIFPMVLIPPKALLYITVPLQDHIIHPLRGGKYNLSMAVHSVP